MVACGVLDIVLILILRPIMGEHGLNCVYSLGMPQVFFTNNLTLNLFKEFTRRKTVLLVSVAGLGGQLLDKTVLKK
jgi:hypothetical protein